MRIWKLAPVDPTDSIWKDWKSTPMFVRAESEAEARNLAESRTLKFFRARPGMPLPINPWGRHQKIGEPWPTICEDVTEQTNEYSPDGSAGVLNRAQGDG